SVFFATYAAVFIAEIVGDKLLYTTGVLATRYRSLPIMIGVTVAFMLKMGVAVLVGDAIAHLPKPAIAAMTTVSFLGIALTLWRKAEVKTEAQEARSEQTAKPAIVSFAAIFLSEWGDIG